MIILKKHLIDLITFLWFSFSILCHFKKSQKDRKVSFKNQLIYLIYFLFIFLIYIF